MELLDFARLYKVLEDGETPKEQSVKRFVKEELRSMLASGRLPKEYAEAVSESKICRFLESDSAGRMARAAQRGQLYREQPFVLGIPASRLREEFPESETVLMQGIIDVFWEEEDGIVVLDYKTDAVQLPEELVKRYHVQLDCYAQALERIYTDPVSREGRRVKEKVIYSFKLGEEIRL